MWPYFETRAPYDVISFAEVFVTVVAWHDNNHSPYTQAHQAHTWRDFFFTFRLFVLFSFIIFWRTLLKVMSIEHGRCILFGGGGDAGKSQVKLI